MKDKRAVGTRYDKFALSYQAMVQAALIYSYLRCLHPSTRPKPPDIDVDHLMLPHPAGLRA